MANVLVFGHQNPDNDAIMSAVVLSQLLNQVEYAGNTYEACALGQLPAESAKLLAAAKRTDQLEIIFRKTDPVFLVNTS